MNVFVAAPEGESAVVDGELVIATPDTDCFMVGLASLKATPIFTVADLPITQPDYLHLLMDLVAEWDDNADEETKNDLRAARSGAAKTAALMLLLAKRFTPGTILERDGDSISVSEAAQ